MELPSPAEGIDLGRRQTRFRIGSVESELSIIWTSGNVEETVGFISLERGNGMETEMWKSLASGWYLKP